MEKVNTKESYLFTDLEVAKEASDYQSKVFGGQYAVVALDLEVANYIVTAHWPRLANTKPLYISEVLDDQ